MLELSSQTAPKGTHDHQHSRPKALRRTLVAILAALAGLTLAGPAQADAAVQSETDAWLQYQPPTTGVTPFLFGGFSTEKRACERRTVSIYRSKDLMNWDTSGTPRG